MMSAILSIAIGVVLVAAGAGLWYAVWQPLARAPKSADRNRQYFLGDLLSLVLLLQMPLASLAVEERWFGLRAELVPYGAGLGALGVGLAWWYGVRILSRRGIDAPRRRAVFLLVILPVAALGLAAASFAMLPVLTFALGILPDRPSGSAMLRIGLVALLMPLVCYALRLLTRWVVSGPKKEQGRESSPDSAPPRHKGHAD